MGVVSALALVTTLFVTFGTLAIPAAAVKHIPEFFGRGRPDVSKGIYKEVLKFGFLVGGVLSILCLVASTTISMVLLGNNNYQHLIAVLSLDVFALFLLNFYNAILAGVKKFKEMSIAGIALYAIRYVSSIILLAKGYGLVGAVIGWIVGDWVGLALSIFFASTSFRAIRKQESYPFKQLIMYSIPVYASGILSYLVGTVDKYVVLFFGGLQTLGIYSVALTTTAAINIVASSLGGPLLPQYSELYGQNGKAALEEASKITSRYVFLIYVPLAVGLAATAYPIITFFYGTEYGSGGLLLAIVCVAAALTCAVIVINNLLMSLGDTRTGLAANVLAIALGMPLLVVLVELFGSVGAALVRALIIFVVFAYPAYVLKKNMGLHFDLEAFKKSLISSAVMAAVVVLIQALWFARGMLPLYIAVGGFVYLLMLRLLKAVKEEDVKLFQSVIPKRFHRLANLFAKIYGLKTEKQD